MDDEPAAEMARQLQLEAEYLAECQVTASGFWGNAHLLVGLGAAVSAAAAGASAFAKHTLYAALLSVAASVLSAALTWLKPAERATAHQASGATYKVLAEHAHELESSSRYEIEGASKRSLADLADERDALLRSAPFVNRRLCRKARRFIERGDAYYGGGSQVRQRSWFRRSGGQRSGTAPSETADTSPGPSAS